MNDDKKRSAKEKILQTAHALFYSFGIRATGIDKIIEQAKVTKVTFYRHYPSKNALILAYLDYRHEIWLHWFRNTLEKQIQTAKSPADALAETLEEWFTSPDFRGCAFINATAESGDILEDIQQISRRHKQETGHVISTLLNLTETTSEEEIVMMMDGAIVHAQMGMAVSVRLRMGLAKLLAAD